MQELDKGLDISLSGPEAERALAAFGRQVGSWGIAMPPVKPVVLDFGLGEFDRVGLIEHWISNETEAGYCGKYLFVFNGQQCPAHSHRAKHETFFLVRGRLKITLDGKSVRLKSGKVLPIPPGHVHSFEGEGNSLLLELSMPSQWSDNYFEDPRIMNWLRRVS